MNANTKKWENNQKKRISYVDALENHKERTDKTVKIIKVKAENGHLILKCDKRVKPRKTLKERFANYQGAYYEEKEIDWGAPVGEEVW